MEMEDPKVLYRYRHLDGDHLEGTRRVFTESKMYFASPDDFNDPFDCKVYFRYRINKKALRENHKRLIKKYFPDLIRDERRRKLKQDFKTTDLRTFVQNMTAGLQSSVNKLGILCLSGTNKNILLWSHYSASHTGICLKFEATNHTPFFGLAQKVTY